MFKRALQCTVTLAHRLLIQAQSGNASPHLRATFYQYAGQHALKVLQPPSFSHTLLAFFAWPFRHTRVGLSPTPMEVLYHLSPPAGVWREADDPVQLDNKLHLQMGPLLIYRL